MVGWSVRFGGGLEGFGVGCCGGGEGGVVVVLEAVKLEDVGEAAAFEARVDFVVEGGAVEDGWSQDEPAETYD